MLVGNYALQKVCIESLLTTTVGKTLAYTNIRFTNLAGDIVARGSHTKYTYTILMQDMIACAN